VKEDLMKRIRRILHASDFSGPSRPAFARAIEFAKLARAELTVVHVLTPVVPYVGEGYVSPQLFDQVVADLQTRARKQLNRMLARARASGVRAKGLIVEGVPSDRIVRAARAKRSNLIVMGTHGHTGLVRMILGSVAARVVATAPCPVLTVRSR
jgi:nucleotide-binding universal stress UspA family protein